MQLKNALLTIVLGLTVSPAILANCNKEVFLNIKEKYPSEYIIVLKGISSYNSKFVIKTEGSTKVPTIIPELCSGNYMISITEKRDFFKIIYSKKFSLKENRKTIYFYMRDKQYMLPRM